LANRIDAMTIARACDWVVCELIGVHHNLSLEEAQDLVDGLSQRNIPDIWQVAGKKRVLRHDLDFKQKVLLLCYQEPENAVLSEDLFSWAEYSDFAMFKRIVLMPLHKKRLIEYDGPSTDAVLPQWPNVLTALPTQPPLPAGEIACFTLGCRSRAQLAVGADNDALEQCLPPCPFHLPYRTL
jgi:hypothetical protein